MEKIQSGSGTKGWKWNWCRWSTNQWNWQMTFRPNEKQKQSDAKKGKNKTIRIKINLSQIRDDAIKKRHCKIAELIRNDAIEIIGWQQHCFCFDDWSGKQICKFNIEVEQIGFHR